MGAGGPSKQQAKKAKYRAELVAKEQEAERWAEQLADRVPRSSPKASPSGSPRTSFSKETAGSLGSQDKKELAAADCKWHRRHCLDGDLLQASTIREAYPFDDSKQRAVRGSWRDSSFNDQVIDAGPKKIYCDTCGVFIVGRDGNCSFYFCRKCRDQGRKLELCVKCYRKGELGSGPRRIGPADIFETREERTSKRERTNSGSRGPPSRHTSGRSVEITTFCDDNGVQRPVSPLQSLPPRPLISTVSKGGDYNANLGGPADAPPGSARSARSATGSQRPSSVRSGRSGVSSVGTVGAGSVNAKRCYASGSSVGGRSRSGSVDDLEPPWRGSRGAAAAAGASSELPARPPTGEWKGTITEEGVARSTNRQLRFAESGALTGTETGEGFDVAISGAFVAKKRTVSWVEVHPWGRVKFDGHVTWSSGNFVIKGTFVTTDESKGKLELTRPP